MAHGLLATRQEPGPVEEPGQIPKMSWLFPNFLALIFSRLRIFVPGSKIFMVAKNCLVHLRMFLVFSDDSVTPIQIIVFFMSIGIKIMPRDRFLIPESVFLICF